MNAPDEFREGDVIIHDVGSETNESTWVRGPHEWRTTNGVTYNDSTAREWLVGGYGKLIHRSPGGAS